MRLAQEPHKIKVYEKLKTVFGVTRFFNLVDAKIVNTGVRNVFKFYLSLFNSSQREKKFHFHTQD